MYGSVFTIVSEVAAIIIIYGTIAGVNLRWCVSQLGHRNKCHIIAA